MLKNTLPILRQKKGLTQKELAEKLNITRSSLSLYELGKRDPDTNTLKEIATFFNVSTDYLLELTCSNSHLLSDKPIKQSERMDKALELLEKFEKLPYDKQRAIEILIGMSEQAATRLPEAK